MLCSNYTEYAAAWKYLAIFDIVFAWSISDPLSTWQSFPYLQTSMEMLASPKSIPSYSPSLTPPHWVRGVLCVTLCPLYFSIIFLTWLFISFISFLSWVLWHFISSLDTPVSNGASHVLQTFYKHWMNNWHSMNANEIICSGRLFNLIIALN